MFSLFRCNYVLVASYLPNLIETKQTRNPLYIYRTLFRLYVLKSQQFDIATTIALSDDRIQRTYPLDPLAAYGKSHARHTSHVNTWKHLVYIILFAVVAGSSRTRLRCQQLILRTLVIYARVAQSHEYSLDYGLWCTEISIEHICRDKIMRQRNVKLDNIPVHRWRQQNKIDLNRSKSITNHIQNTMIVIHTSTDMILSVLCSRWNEQPSVQDTTCWKRIVIIQYRWICRTRVEWFN